MNNPQSPIMGLSNVSRLQQSKFLPPWRESYLAFFKGRNLVVYKGRKNYNKARQLSEKQLGALRGAKFTGSLSNQSQKKMVTILQNWNDTIEHVDAIKVRGKVRGNKQLIMITLTLSAKQTHTDNQIKRQMLNRFLINLIRKEDRAKYLWKAESQKNGNIHFHIIVDEYFDKHWINNLWNKIQFDNGYISIADYKDKEKIVPSTRIESLRDKDDAISYTAKYISKNNTNRLLEGRLWGCSKELKDLKKCEIVLSREELLDIVDTHVTYEKNLFTTEFATIISNIKEYKTLKMNLFSRHNYLETIIQHNIDIIHLRPLCPEFAIEDTEWYYELMASEHSIESSYLLNNGLLFPDSY